jgi:methyl-accepting chemotaxis protein
MKLNLTSKLLIPLGCLVALGLMVAIFTAYISAKNGLEKSATSRLLQTASATETKVSQWIQRNAITLDTWAKMDVMINSLSSPDNEAYLASASHHMKDYVDTYNIFSGMRLTDNKGIVVASSHADIINKLDVSSREYFKVGLAGDPFITAPLRSKTTDKPILVMSSPVEKSGRVLGILYVVVDLGAFTSAQLDTIKVGETGYVYMLNTNGLTLAYPPDKKKIMDLNINNFEFGQKIMEMKNGVYRYKYAGIDKMAAFKEIKKTGWIVVATAPSDEVFAEADKIRNLLMVIGAVLTAILCAGIVILARVFIINPLKIVVEGLKDIAEGDGDLTKQLPVSSRDELGELSQWFNTFLLNLQQIIKDIASSSGQVGQSSGNLLDIAKHLAEQALDASERSDSVAAASEKINENMNEVSQTMGTTKDNANMVAAATEEMTSTINEIATNSETARTISTQAVEQATTVSEKMTELGMAAQTIGAVTETINDISEQTNLLALNATIEAARAGEAGKGFAVVAGEIKELATQTAKATAEIKEKISGVQKTTITATDEINAISTIITDINDITSTIAAAIQEQSSSTVEITNNIAQTSQSIEAVTERIVQGVNTIETINHDIASVNTSMGGISDGSNGVQANAEELQQMATELNNIIGKFKY